VLEQLLALAPHEDAGALRYSQALLSLPLPNGGLAHFRIAESPVMEKDLAALFPQIKSYRGEAVDVPGMSLRFDWSPAGLHAWLLKDGHLTSITPASGNDRTIYLSQSGANLRSEDFRCLTAAALPGRKFPLAASCALTVWPWRPPSSIAAFTAATPTPARKLR
jgi:hypothetical protein